MNYNSLMNKPTINYRELIGDNTVTEVGGITEEQFNSLLNTDLSSYYTKAQIDDLFSRSYVYREKSGSIVTFDCPANTNGISEVTSEIVAVQSGTGDPSPTNVRPINGWSAVNVVVSPTTDAEDGTTYTTTLKDGQGNPMTCYGGTLTNENGVQTLENILGQQNMANWNWARESTGGGNYRFRSKSTVWSEYQRQSTIGLSSAFTINRSPIGGAKIDNTLWVHSDGLVYIYCDTYTDVDTFKEFIKDVQLFLPRINPTQITQDNLAIASSAGINNIWCDSGDITVKALDRIIQG